MKTHSVTQLTNHQENHIRLRTVRRRYSHGMRHIDENDPDEFPPIAPPSWLITRVIRRIFSIIFRPVREIFFLISWIIWLFSSITLGTGQLSIVLYSAIRITISLLLYLFVMCAFKVHTICDSLYNQTLCYSQRHVPRIEKIRIKKIELEEATNLDEWQHVALELDELCGHAQWKNQSASTDYDYRLLRQISSELIAARQNADYKALTYHLTNIMSRQFCNLQSEKLYASAYHGTKYSIEEFYGRVVEQLSFVARTDFGPEFTTRHKLRFFQRARRTIGRTVLCLSGGGALAMYHTGVARAMVKGNCLPSILNGTSGGSIIAALIGTRTDAELKDPEFFAPSLCQRYGAEHRWLPTLQQQVDQFISKRVLMDHKVFSRSAQAFFGHLTFEDAYRRTQRVLCITVTWSARGAGGKPHPLVLNHITSPRVFVWSAVACSCALPGLMVPQNLYAKGPDGSVCEYYPSGSEIIDGSLQADIPVQRLTELFNAQTFIVSQTNPHVIDFVRDGSEGRGAGGSISQTLSVRTHSFLSGMEKFLQADIGHRLKRLAKMKVIPKIYQQDFSEVLSGVQQYKGDINIVPAIPFLMRFKALTHPSVDDMVEYFNGGERATYPKISRIQNCLLLERTLEECVRSLTNKMKADNASNKRERRRNKHTTGSAAATGSASSSQAPARHASPFAELSPEVAARTVIVNGGGSSSSIGVNGSNHRSQPFSPTNVPSSSSIASSTTSTPSAHPRTPPRRRPTANTLHPSTHGTTIAASSGSHTPTRPPTTVSGVILPRALEEASSAAFRVRSTEDRSYSSLSGLQTPTATILAQLPLHGGAATEQDVLEDEPQDSNSSAVETDGGGSAGISAGVDVVGSDSDSESAGSADNSDRVGHPMYPFTASHATSHASLSGGYQSDESTTTTASYVDFDADEMANAELDPLGDGDGMRTPTLPIGGAHTPTVPRTPNSASRRGGRTRANTHSSTNDSNDAPS